MSDDTTPVLIGAAQHTERNTAPDSSPSPIALAATAAGAALADTGRPDEVRAALDTVVVIRTFADSAPPLDPGFGRAANPPGAVASAIGATGVRGIYGAVGGNTPQRYVAEMARAIRNGDAGCVLLTGAEAMATQKAAQRAGVRPDWSIDNPGEFEDRARGDILPSPHEIAHGIGIPALTYPLFEQAVRGRIGASQAEHLASLGRLLAPFTEVAAANPHAWSRDAHTAESLSTASERNPFIAWPYTRRMNARDGVNQAAAVVITSVGRARALGIPPDRWVYLQGAGEASDASFVSRRADFHSSAGIRTAAHDALTAAGADIDDIAAFDLYSCFPSAIEIAATELGVAADDPRGLTLTGGLPFFGGPGNNYAMHAIAEAVARCRERPDERVMITAVSGYLTGHAIGIYCSAPAPRTETAPGRAPPADGGPAFTETPAGDATIETYTVAFHRGVPVRGIVIGRTAPGSVRFLANTPHDAQLLAAMCEDDFLGVEGRVAQAGDVNVFTPA